MTKKIKALVAENKAGQTKNELFISPQIKNTNPPSTPKVNPENRAYSQRLSLLKFILSPLRIHTINSKFRLESFFKIT